MRNFVIPAVAVLAAVATPALAQDAATFTGPRVEGLVGWDRVENDFTHQDGVQYGIGAGYDMQMGSALVGIEGEVGDSTTKRCVGDVSAVGDRYCLRTGRDLYIGGRVGTVVGGRTLLYAKAGYTNARGRETYRAVADDDNETISARNYDGIRVGAGAEYAVGPNSYVKAEYRYSNYEDGLSRNQVVGGFGFRF